MLCTSLYIHMLVAVDPFLIIPKALAFLSGVLGKVSADSCVCMCDCLHFLTNRSNIVF